MKPRILIIDNSTAVTGALKSILRSSSDLKEYFDFQFIIPANSQARASVERSGFARVHELPMKELSRRLSSLLLYMPFLMINILRVRRIIKREQISLVHVNDLFNLIPALLSIFCSAPPYVCHVRFMPDKFPGSLFHFWLKLHLKYAGRIIAVSRNQLNKLPAHNKLTMIYNELPISVKYPRVPLVRKEVYRFLYLSNFIVGKGQEYALAAFARIAEELPDWRLRFVGGDMNLKKNREYREGLKQRAKGLGIFEKTEWIGFTDDVEREYKDADIVLNFSESESFSFTCVEALFYGRPVIATACGGPEEIVDDGETGFIVQNKNIEAMAAAMKELAMDEKRRAKMGIVAPKLAKLKFSFENTSLRLKELYDEVLTECS